MYLGQAGSVRSLRLHIRDVAAEALKLLHRRVKRHDPLRGGRRRVGRHPLSRAGPVRSDPETRHFIQSWRTRLKRLTDLVELQLTSHEPTVSSELLFYSPLQHHNIHQNIPGICDSFTKARQSTNK